MIASTLFAVRAIASWSSKVVVEFQLVHRRREKTAFPPVIRYPAAKNEKSKLLSEAKIKAGLSVDQSNPAILRMVGSTQLSWGCGFLRPVAFRPHLAMSLAFSEIRLSWMAPKGHP